MLWLDNLRYERHLQSEISEHQKKMITGFLLTNTLTINQNYQGCALVCQ